MCRTCGTTGTTTDPDNGSLDTKKGGRRKPFPFLLPKVEQKFCFVLSFVVPFTVPAALPRTITITITLTFTITITLTGEFS